MEVSYPAADRFLSQLPAESFDRLVMLGMAGLSQRMQFEMVARNWGESTPDVHGAILEPGPINSNDPMQFTLTTNIVMPSRKHWEINSDAGGYLCNYSFFRTKQRFPTKERCRNYFPISTGRWHRFVVPFGA